MTPPIRDLSELADLHAVAGLFDEIWQPGPGDRPVTADLLRALSKAGNYVAGAYDGDRLAGAAFGFFGPPRSRTLHSHITGVRSSARGLGHALKLHQRDWALARGVHTIEWTFDPLVSRNAYFNLAKLGARPVEYLTNFYGPMTDGINGADDSDRLLVHWDLTGPVGRPVAEQAGAVIALDREEGRPVPRPTDAETLLIAVPQDVESLRRTDPQAAAAWRTALRSVLQPLLTAGAQVTGFDRDGWYVVSR